MRSHHCQPWAPGARSSPVVGPQPIRRCRVDLMAGRNFFIMNWQLLYNSLVMIAQGGWRSRLGDLNCYWMWECFTALNLLKVGQVPGTWTKNMFKPLFFSSPKVFTYIDRTVVFGMSGKHICFCRNACTWHWVWRVRLSELQTPPSSILPGITWLSFSTGLGQFSVQSLRWFPLSALQLNPPE